MLSTFSQHFNIFIKIIIMENVRQLTQICHDDKYGMVINSGKHLHFHYIFSKLHNSKKKQIKKIKKCRNN